MVDSPEGPETSEIGTAPGGPERPERPMPADELGRLCTRLYGTRRWQTALARELRVNDRTVRRWASGRTAVPHPVALCIRLMAFLDELSWLGEWRQLMEEEEI